MTDWHSGLCDCTEDCSSCCLSWLVPFVQYGINESKLGDGSCCLCGTLFLCCGHFACCFIWNQRGKVRAKYGIAGGGCSDGLASWCCPLCTLCQIAREIDFQKAQHRSRRQVVYVVNNRVPQYDDYSYDCYGDSDRYNYY